VTSRRWLVALVSLMTSLPVIAAPQCQKFSIESEVKDKASLHQPIGMGLSFRMEPTVDEDGWQFEIGPTQPSAGEWNQYIYTMTPPWRGRNPTMLDTSYSTLAQDAVTKVPHNFWFLLNRNDASKAYSALDQWLWPKNDKLQDESLALLGSLPKGQGFFQVLDSEIIPGTAQAGDDPSHAFFGTVRSVVFRVEFIVPHDFKPATGLHSGPAICPKPDDWLK